MQSSRTLASAFAACLSAGVTLAADDSPRVTHVCAVAPDVIAITVQAGRVEGGGQVPYEKRPGDRAETWKGKGHGPLWVVRDGRRIGTLVGKGGDVLWRFERVEGAPLDVKRADDPASYSVSSRDDAAFADPVRPAAVWRKSKPSDLARAGDWKWAMPLTHVLYLKLPRALETRKPPSRYEIAMDGLGLPRQEYIHDPRRSRSDAVHVSHVGFRPHDPAKVAFLSCWTGTGGGVAYGEGMHFEVLNERTRRSVFWGRTRLTKRAGEPEDPYRKNYNGADVHMMDFSDVAEPGRYVVWVDGVGCSYPFEIGPGVWRKAFRVSARGLYHQRSGIELGLPYTECRRPRCFHPDDGMKVYHSTCPLMDTKNGLNARGTDKSNFANLVAGKTNMTVPDAWGGYFDAGDWDRRIQHLSATRLHLELAELFPRFVAGLGLGIPESGNDIPDLVDEAMWNLDCYRRMQTPDGGIRGGIESAEHPRQGEASWQESLTVMAYAPGVWSSHVYAGIAARAAGVLRALPSPKARELAAAYERSTVRAMEWAERELPKRAAEKLPHAVRDARNLAAAELFRLTGDARWHRVFLETTAFKDPKADVYKWKSHDQRDAAFVYARTEREGLDEAIRANARAAVIREADASVSFQQGTGYRWTKMNAWQPLGWGMVSVPQAETILRAHALTGDARYLRSAVLASQLGAGANPLNMCYTTGLGPTPPRHPLVVDHRMARLPAPPPGITVFGPQDTARHGNYWVVKLMKPVLAPEHAKWPSMDGYFDVFMMPDPTEFTIQQTIGPNSYVWGYLAARE
ncbi:MAG: glycoside hydrolase family 9 protein [Planctomycetota bacterium]|jgi:endoglucanase